MCDVLNHYKLCAMISGLLPECIHKILKYIILRSWIITYKSSIKRVYTTSKPCYNSTSGPRIMNTLTRIQTPAEAALSLVQREFPQYHPLLGLARLVHSDKVSDDPRLEYEIHKAILPYVVPKLSSVEVKADVREERRVIVSLFEEHTLEDGTKVTAEVPLITDVTDIVPLDR